jgi:hypothetical protein
MLPNFQVDGLQKDLLDHRQRIAAAKLGDEDVVALERLVEAWRDVDTRLRHDGKTARAHELALFRLAFLFAAHDACRCLFGGGANRSSGDSFGEFRK